MTGEINRRAFVEGSLGAGLAAAAVTAGFGRGALQAAQAPPTAVPAQKPAAVEPQMTVPQGKIGNLQFSRIILGGNLLSHTTHSRDLQYVTNLAAHYNTDDKIIETLRIAEEHGINTVSVISRPQTLNVLFKYRRAGGKIQWIIAPFLDTEMDVDKLAEVVHQVVDQGCEAVYLSGFHSDVMLSTGKGAAIGEAVEKFKSAGVSVGVGAHDLGVVEYCEKNGIASDFYVKTFHHHNYPTGPRAETGILKWATAEVPGFWCNNPQKTIDVMKPIKKPWIAFKVMAAGAIPPEDGFRYAFANGADFCLAGMFDYEIAPDAELINKILTPALPKRERPWMA